MDGLITVQTYAQHKERSTRKHYNIAVRSGAGPSAMGTERDRWSICTCPTHRSSPMEELHKNKRRSDDSGRQEKTRTGLLFVLCAAVVREGLPL